MENKTQKNRNGSEDLVGYLVSEIRKRIIRWEYLPGTRLLEKELSESFGISRIPLREAMRVLEANGFLVNTPQKGYSVKNISIQDTLDLYDVRIALEMHICEQLASKELPEETLETLRGMWSAKTIGKLADAEALAKQDRLFHETLAEAHGNEYLLKQLKDLNDRIDFLRVIDFQQENIISAACNDHLNIVRKIEEHDARGAREAVRGNILHAHENIHKGLSEMLARNFINR